MYSFTGDSLFKEKAVHIVDKLLPAFKTPTGIPYALVNMRSGVSTVLRKFELIHIIVLGQNYTFSIESINSLILMIDGKKFWLGKWWIEYIV